MKNGIKIEIMKMLFKTPMRVRDLASKLDESLQTVYVQLRILQAGEIILKNGVYYNLDNFGLEIFNNFEDINK